MTTVIGRFDGNNVFLSNFYFHARGETVEHRFQAAKTLDPAQQKVILAASGAAQAKVLGRNVDLRPDWEQVKDMIMLELLREKFSIPEMKEKLLATGNAILIEGNTWHDQYWGDCVCQNHQSIPGKNMLGQLLMRVRTELQVGGEKK